jgi:hypothetical protein
MGIARAKIERCGEVDLVKIQTDNSHRQKQRNTKSFSHDRSFTVYWNGPEKGC